MLKSLVLSQTNMWPEPAATRFTRQTCTGEPPGSSGSKCFACRIDACWNVECVPLTRSQIESPSFVARRWFSRAPFVVENQRETIQRH